MTKLSKLRRILNDNQVANYINNTTAGQKIRGLSNGCSESRLVRRILGPLFILDLVIFGAVAGLAGYTVYENKEKISREIHSNYQKIKLDLDKSGEIPYLDARGFI